MTFWNDSYKNEMNSISRYLKSEFIDESSIQKDLDFIPAQELVDSIIVLAWNYFEKVFTNRRDLLNSYTKFNQAMLEDRAKPKLEELKENRLYFLSNLLRVVYEYYFWTQSSVRTPIFISSRVLENLDKITPMDEYQVQFIWIERSMPSAMTMFLLQSSEFDTMKKMASDIDGYKEKIKEQSDAGTEAIDKSIAQYIESTNELILKVESSQKSLEKYDERLSGYKNEFNFVLLSKSFSNLLETKKGELSDNKKTTSRFFTALISIPIIALINHVFDIHQVTLDINAIAFYLPILTLELMCFYFMRLYYIEGKIIKTQMLQIEHRLSLCEFIHDYIEKKNTDKENKESWDIFESLIFSPIQVTPDNIPSVLDGANAVAELAGKVMAKSKSS